MSAETGSLGDIVIGTIPQMRDIELVEALHAIADEIEARSMQRAGAVREMANGIKNRLKGKEG